ncbi:hypothetical protein [Halalkalibacterium halodurans]|uniref:hypothetical protein n=1 Tax=Halalkalibacterium halodurans TaxID=86665 RepID=UPI0005A237AF|nr:hypothetical protein [Halalkalibacterium halodurans]
MAGQDDVVQNKAESKAVGEVDLVLHGGGIMKLLIILVALVCIVALVITLALNLKTRVTVAIKVLAINSYCTLLLFRL